MRDLAGPGPRPLHRSLHGEDSKPLLFVSSRFDAASSYEHTRTLVASIPGARLLTIEGAGHPASFVGDLCIGDAVASYLVELELPAAGAVCEPDLQPFDVGNRS